MRFTKADPVIRRQQYFSLHILLKYAVAEQQILFLEVSDVNKCHFFLQLSDIWY